MESRYEKLDFVGRLIAKLEELPSASPLEAGAFAVLILFICIFFLMVLLCCAHCCLCGKPKTQGSKVDSLDSL